MVYLCDLHYGDMFYWCGDEYYHDTVYAGNCPGVLSVRRVRDGQVIRLRSHTEVEVQ